MEVANATGRRVSISGMLKHLGVSRSGYRAFLKHRPTASQKRRNAMKDKIQQVYDDSHQIYGAPKIAVELRKDGERIATRTVGKYMRQMGIRAHWVKHWTRTTIDSDIDNKLHNILNEQFNPDRPNAAWCTDITYIWTYDGYVYLTSVMDLFSRKIIAWTLSDSLEASCVIDTINQAKAVRPTTLPLIIHSDRGSQYVSAAYVDATRNMQRSYSRTGNPYDNACIEAFHSLIKREWIKRFRIQGLYQAKMLVFEYIETFYNTVRTHSHCGYVSPDEYERQYQKLMSKYERTTAV